MYTSIWFGIKDNTVHVNCLQRVLAMSILGCNMAAFVFVLLKTLTSNLTCRLSVLIKMYAMQMCVKLRIHSHLYCGIIFVLFQNSISRIFFFEFLAKLRKRRQYSKF